MAVITATRDLPLTQAVSTSTTMEVLRVVPSPIQATPARPPSTKAGAATCARLMGHMRPSPSHRPVAVGTNNKNGAASASNHNCEYGRLLAPQDSASSPSEATAPRPTAARSTPRNIGRVRAERASACCDICRASHSPKPENKVSNPASTATNKAKAP